MCRKWKGKPGGNLAVPKLEGAEEPNSVIVTIRKTSMDNECRHSLSANPLSARKVMPRKDVGSLSPMGIYRTIPLRITTTVRPVTFVLSGAMSRKDFSRQEGASGND